MIYRQLGRSGPSVSMVGLGCNNFGTRLDAAATARVVGVAVDSGVTLFDTADIYGFGRSEEMLGAALRGRRHDVVIASKFGYAMGAEPTGGGGSRSYVLRAAEDSLRRLGTDHIDLYQMHLPDPSTPLEDTLAALDSLVRSGKVRFLGSSFAGWQIAEASAIAANDGFNAFVSAQNHYSLIERTVEVEVLPACTHFGVGMLPYFPLAGGLLTGKYRRGEPPPSDGRLATAPNAAQFLNDANFAAVDDLRAFAADRGIGLLDVAIGGLAAQPGVVSVIAGATSPEQVLANVAAGRFRPSAEDLVMLDRLSPTRRPPV